MQLTTAQMLSLRDFLDRVPDPCRRQGKRYPWSRAADDRAGLVHGRLDATHRD